MYLKFFGFQRAPFELVPDPDFLFLGDAHDAALANLVMGLESGKGFVAISGPVGAGKTTILRALLRRLKRAERICFLTQPEMEVKDLLRAVLDGFGQPSEDLAIVDLRRAIREFLVAGDGPGILIVDEAHLLSEESMEQLRLLSNLEEDHRKILQIVLSGQPELKDLLSRPRLRPLAQRIEMFYDIRALDRQETGGYIERRLRIAGSPETVRFDANAVDMIHHCSAGIPRLINLLADRALVAGYVADTGEINPDLVREAYEDLGEVTRAVMPGSPRGGRRVVRPAPRPSAPVAAPSAPRTEAPAPSAPTSAVPMAAVRAPEAPAAPAPVPEPAAPAPAASFPPPPPLPPRAEPARREEPAVVRLVEPASAGRRRRQPRPRKPRSTNDGGAQRWIAIIGVAAVAVLAIVSLGGRGLASMSSGGATATAIPEPAAEGATIPVFTAAPVPEAGAAAAPAETYGVHVASFRDVSSARALAADLETRLAKPAHVNPTELETGLWYRVVIGSFASAEDARLLMKELTDLGGFSFVRTVRMVRPVGDAPSPAGVQS